MTQLKDIIREIINEQIAAMDEESQAVKDAKAAGLTYMEFGRWGKDGVQTHKSERGRLVPVKNDKDVGLRRGKLFGRNKLYRAMPSHGAKGLNTRPAAIIGPDGKLQRAEPRWTPNVQRQRNRPQDDLEKNYSDDPFTRVGNLIHSKIFDTAKFSYGQEIPKDEFLKKTGLTQKTVDKWLSSEEKYGADDAPMFYDDGETITIVDPFNDDDDF